MTQPNKNRAFRKTGKKAAVAAVMALTMTAMTINPFGYAIARADGAETPETTPQQSWRSYDEFSSEYLTREAYRKEALTTNQKIVEEGAVLLKNDGALPLKKDAKITIMGKNSVNIVYQGSGSSGNAGSFTKNVYDAFAASDMKVNPVAKAFYENNELSGIGRPGIPTFGNIPSGQPIGETRAVGALDYGGAAYNMKEVDAENANFDPASTDSNYDQVVTGTFNKTTYESKPWWWDMYGGGQPWIPEEHPLTWKNPKLSDTYSEYGDAAVVFISRIGGEGYDLPRTMVMNPTIGNNQYPSGSGNGNYANRPQNLATDAIENALMVPGARSKDSHYMQLDQNELNLLKEAAANFNNVIVVLNSASAVELDFLDTEKYDWANKIKGCMWIATPGENGLMALPRLLDGTVNPSGSLVDTYYKNFLDQPVMQNFSNNAVQDGNRMQNPDGSNTPLYFVDYQEDIYLGYRYYETKYAETLEADGEEAANTWYNANVSYPFGHGLSYTTFTTTVESWSLDGATKANNDSLTLKNNSVIEVKVKVENTGEVAGKKAVQIYAEAPYEAGGIEKASKVLVGYDKTGLLEPGASEVITISCPVYYFASWDGTDANVDDHIGYEIEAGNYKLHVANNAHDTAVEVPFRVGAQLNIDKDPSSGKDVAPIFPEMTEYMNTEYNEVDHKGSARLSREDNFANIADVTKGNTRRVKTAEEIGKYMYNINTGSRGNYDQATGTSEEKAARATQLFTDLHNYIGFDVITKPYAIQHTATSTEYSDDIINYVDMYGVDYNDAKWDQFMAQLTWQEMANLIASGSNIRFSSLEMANLGKPATIHNDGPLGWSTKTNTGEMAYNTTDTKYRERYWFPTDDKGITLALASTCLVAASMDQDFQLEVGTILGEDALWGFENIDSMTNSGGYAPGANTHRTPFSGRNFEYFSEDGVLAGITAGQIMVGEQNKGNFSFIKHFFMNDQETNRDGNMLATWATEQTMREIYGRSFEIAIKMAIANNPKLVGVMTAFARNGYVYCGSSDQLLNDLLRGEWGFNGDVITDWTGSTSGPMNSVAVVMGGGSKELGTAPLPINDEMLNEPTYGNTYKWNIMRAAKDILFSDVNSNNIVVAKSVRTMPINLTSTRFNSGTTAINYFKDGKPEAFKVGKPLYFDLRKDTPDAVNPDVWYGDKTEVKYEYYMADGYELPKGLNISKDGVLYGTPEEATDGAITTHVFVKATGKHNGKDVEYYGANQVIRIEIGAYDSSEYKPQPVTKINQSGVVANVESGAVNVTLTTDAAEGRTAVFHVDESTGLPEGFTLAEDGTLTGTVAADTKAYTHVFKVYADVFEGGKYVETTEKTLMLQLGKGSGTSTPVEPTNGVKSFTSSKVDGGTKYVITLDDDTKYEFTVPDAVTPGTPNETNGVKSFTSSKVEGGTKYVLTLDDDTTCEFVVPDATTPAPSPAKDGGNSSAALALGIVALVLSVLGIGGAVAYVFITKKKGN